MCPSIIHVRFPASGHALPSVSHEDACSWPACESLELVVEPLPGRIIGVLPLISRGCFFFCNAQCNAGSSTPRSKLLWMPPAQQQRPKRERGVRQWCLGGGLFGLVIIFFFLKSIFFLHANLESKYCGASYKTSTCVSE